jgi:hypothetical protein
MVILERGIGMKNIPILLILAALLAGCAVGRAGYGDNGEGYYHDSNRGAGKNQNYDYNQGAGNERDYRYRGEPGDQGDLFLYHSSS